MKYSFDDYKEKLRQIPREVIVDLYGDVVLEESDFKHAKLFFQCYCPGFHHVLYFLGDNFPGHSYLDSLGMWQFHAEEINVPVRNLWELRVRPQFDYHGFFTIIYYAVCSRLCRGILEWREEPEPNLNEELDEFLNKLQRDEPWEVSDELKQAANEAIERQSQPPKRSVQERIAHLAKSMAEFTD